MISVNVVQKKANTHNTQNTIILKFHLTCFLIISDEKKSPPCKSKHFWYSLCRIATGKPSLLSPPLPPSRRVPWCKTLDIWSGTRPSSPTAHPAPPLQPHLLSLFRMILIDSFIDCKEIGCSYNTAGLFAVMKKGMWPWACNTDGEGGRKRERGERPVSFMGGSYLLSYVCRNLAAQASHVLPHSALLPCVLQKPSCVLSVVPYLK